MAVFLPIILTVLIVFVYLPALALLFIYSANLYYMTALALIRRHRRPRHLQPLMNDLPFVTIQLPLYNERFVGRRIIDAAAALKWHPERLEIQVLDDSTDDTAQIVAEAIKRLKAQGINIEHVRRPDRKGYKAGALAYGLEQAKGEYIAIFDADFVPAPSFLLEMVPALMNDPGAAFVQARWEHLNRGNSWLTEIQAIAIDGHFAIEQQARCFGNFAFNFNGTAGVWRRTAIDNAGGWKDTTLTEDLDLSYRAWLKGWRGLYERQIVAPAELPPTMTAFRRQQARWAQGSIESARMLLGPVWRSDYPLFVKLQATIHLLGYLVNPVMAVLVICYPLVLLLMKAFPPSNEMFALFSSLGPLTLAPTIFFLVSQLLLRRGWKSLLNVVLFQIISAGLAMNTMRATLKALVNQRGEFLRTPKWGSAEPLAHQEAHLSSAQPTPVYRIRADVGVLTDLIWGLLCFLLVIVSIGSGHIFITAYALLSSFGALWVGSWTLWPEVRSFFYRAPRPVLTTSKARS